MLLLAERERVPMEEGTYFTAGRIVAGRYEIKRRLGSGGMAHVYLAWDTKLYRDIALKTIRLDRLKDQKRADILRARLLREARAAAQLNHPNIVVIHDLGETEGLPYISMEYIPGVNMRHVLQDHPGFPLNRFFTFARQIASAIDYAHGCGIIHRDIKPENIMIKGDDLAKITDFGIARIQSVNQTTLTTDGKLVCTYHYTAPEYFEGKKGDYRADVFSFGCVLYEMLLGCFAFQGDTEPQVWWKIVHGEPRRPSAVNPSLPAETDVFFRKILSKKPDERFRSCSEAVKTLENVFAGVSEDMSYGVSEEETTSSESVETKLLAGRSEAGAVDEALTMLMQSRTKALRLKPHARWKLILAGAVLGGSLALALMFFGPSPTSDQHAETTHNGGFGVKPEMPESFTAATSTPVITASISVESPAKTSPSVDKFLFSITGDTPAPEPSPSLVPAREVPKTAVPTPTPAPRQISNTRFKPASRSVDTRIPPPRPSPIPTETPLPPAPTSSPRPVPTRIPTGTPTPLETADQHLPVDLVKPMIDHRPASSVVLGRSYVVKAKLSGADDESFHLWIRYIKKGVEEDVPMQRKGRNRYEGTIPAEKIRKPILKYRIECRRGTKIVAQTQWFEASVTEPWVPF